MARTRLLISAGPPGTESPEMPFTSPRAAVLVRIDWFIIAIPAPVPIVQFATPPVAFAVMRRAAELCCTAAASCCSSPVSDGRVLTAGAGLALAFGAGLARPGGGVVATALTGLVPGGTLRTGAGTACVLSRAGVGGLRSSPVRAPAPPATAIAVAITISAANSPTRRGPGRPLGAAGRYVSGSTAPLIGWPQSGQNFRPGLFCGFPQFRHENAIGSPMTPITPAVPNTPVKPCSPSVTVYAALRPDLADRVTVR